MNVVVLVGRLAQDPEIRYTTNTQLAVCIANIAVDRGRDRDGNDRGADFIRLKLLGKQAETFHKFLTKGRQIAIQGRLSIDSYVDRNGANRYMTEVVVDRFDFIGSRNDGQPGGGFTRPQGIMDNMGSAPAPSMSGPSDIPEGFEAIDDDDIPF